MASIAKRHIQLAQLSSPAVIRDANNLKRGDAPTSAKGYERALARLGMTILSEQSPELMPYMAGFQLLDKSDEGDFAAGFFVFDVNGTLIDCPIFLIDGKVKGHQLLFLRQQGLFMPNESEVVQYIMTRHNQTLGEASYGEQVVRPNRNSPNFDMFSDRNRYLSKVSSYPSFYDDWSKQSGALESFCSIMASDATRKVAEVAKATGRLPEADWVSLLENPKCASLVKHWCDVSPRFSARIEKAIGADWAEKTAEFYKRRHQAIQERSGLRLNAKRLQFSSSTLGTPKFAAFASPSSIGDVPNRESLVKEYFDVGAVFFDEREGVLKTALLIEENSDRSWQSPIHSGKYTVPLLNGDTMKVSIALPSDRVQFGSSLNCALLMETGTGRIAMVETRDLAVQDDDNEKYDPAEFAESGKLNASGLSAFTPGSCDPEDIIVLVDSRGRATDPFRVTGGSEDGGYELRSAYIESQGQRQPYGDILAVAEPKRSLRPDLLVVKGEPGTSMRLEQVSDMVILYVPKDVKMLKAKQVEDDCCRTVETFRVATLSSLVPDEMFKKASFDIARVTKDVVRINGKAMRQAKAAAFLMTSGLRKEAALAAVLSASDRKKYYLAVPEDRRVSPWQAIARKIAVMRPNMNGDPDYQFRGETQDGRTGESDGFFRMPAQQGVSESQQSTGMVMADESSPPWSSENTPYSEAAVMGGGGGGSGGMAPDAGQMSRDPEAVFDNSLFSTLVNYVNPATDRERLFSGLLRGCDDVGRSLFLTYAHGDEFSNAYGAEDAEDLENQLLRVMESSGKLLIMLLNRSIEDTNDLSLSSLTDS